MSQGNRREGHGVAYDAVVVVEEGDHAVDEHIAEDVVALDGQGGRELAGEGRE